LPSKKDNDDGGARSLNDAISHLISARTTLSVSHRVLASLAQGLVRFC
jgi:hypothetical protein